MSSWHLSIIWLNNAAGAAALGGLLVRRRGRRCYALTLYLASVFAFGLAVGVEPRFNTWTGWLIKETVERLLTISIALEIALRMFATLPNAARSARRAILLVLAVTAAVVFLAPVPEHPPFTHSTPAEVAAFEAALSLLPRLAYGTGWLFTALLLAALRFALPLDPLHRVVLVGFAAYLMLYAVTLGTLRTAAQAAVVSYVNPLAFLAVQAVWTHAAWRREPPPPAPSEVVKRLWPWR